MWVGLAILLLYMPRSKYSESKGHKAKLSQANPIVLYAFLPA